MPRVKRWVVVSSPSGIVSERKAWSRYNAHTILVDFCKSLRENIEVCDVRGNIHDGFSAFNHKGDEIFTAKIRKSK